MASSSSRRKGKDEELARYLPLYKAAFEGDWKRASEIIEREPSAMVAKISKSSKTVLHVATSSGQTSFVEELVKIMPEDALEKQNNLGETALHFAVLAGDIKAAKAIVTKNPNLTQIPNKKGKTPILQAAVLGNKEFFLYLYNETKDEDPSPFRGENGVHLLNATISAQFYDVALCLVQSYPALAITRDKNGQCALDVLARSPSAFRNRSNLRFWQSYIYQLVHVQQASSTPKHHRDLEDPPTQDSRDGTKGAFTTTFQGIHSWLNGLFRNVSKHVPYFKEIYNIKLIHIQGKDLVKSICEEISHIQSHRSITTLVDIPFLKAAEYGSVEFIDNCLQYFPHLMWTAYGSTHTILHIAIAHRQENMFNLIRRKPACAHTLASFVDSDDGSNVLHLAAKLAPRQRLKTVYGSALQMQRELQWFKAVEKIIQPVYKDLENTNSQTPQVLFTEEHEELFEKGEKWMRQKASSCSVIAALISTVVFAAAFTVPGGNSDLGIPIFLERKYFALFAISNALGLISSLISLLIFLSMLSSYYTEEDFLEPLPRKLIMGLATLFLSITAMLVAFGSAYFIMCGTPLEWVAILIASITCLPAILFVFQHIRLLYELFHSTYLCILN